MSNAYIQESVRQAKVNLAFHFMNFLENIYDETDTLLDQKILEKYYGAEFTDIYLSFVNCLKAYNEGEKLSFSEVYALRKRNIHRVNHISTAVDLFNTLEKLQRKAAPNFEPDHEIPAGYSDAAMTEDILNFVAGKEEGEQNLYLVSALSELPVRMTKMKFFDFLSKRLSVFVGADVSAFQDLISNLRAPFFIEADSPQDEALLDLNNTLRNMDLSEESKESFFDIQNTMIRLGEEYSLCFDGGLNLQKVFNSFLILLLSETSETIPEADTLISKLLSGLETPEAFDDCLNDCYMNCEALEGIREEGLYGMEALFKEKDLDDRNFFIIHTLNTGSDFSDPVLLFEGKNKEEASVSESMYRESVNELISDFQGLFKLSKRNYVRGVMAYAFSVLPPFFSSREEIYAYIYDALSSCSDAGEKTCCIESLTEMMRDES